MTSSNLSLQPCTFFKKGAQKFGEKMKENNIFQMDYYQTYYFANICNTVINDPFKYIRILDEFWGNGQISVYLKPFQKYSALHMFIDFSIDRLFYESNKEYEELSIENLIKHEFWINTALNYHNIKHPSFNDWYEDNKISTSPDDLMYAYLESIEYSEYWIDLKIQMVEETFFILFLNRKFLQEFNENMAGILKLENIHEFDNDTQNLFTKKGRLLRKSIPTWAKKAVFYRDRGTCTFCQKDLTGLINISNKYHIDHIVPLAKYGLNDVSNLQLLCDTCNTAKGQKSMKTSKSYEKWY